MSSRIIASLIVLASISLSYADDKNKSGEHAAQSKPNQVGVIVTQWLSEAKDDVQTKLDHLRKEYGQFQKKSGSLADVTAAEMKVLEIDKRITQNRNTVEEIQMEIELLQLKAKLLSKNAAKMEVRKQDQVSKVKKLRETRTTHKYFQSEIARQEATYDEILKKLAEIDLNEAYELKSLEK